MTHSKFRSRFSYTVAFKHQKQKSACISKLLLEVSLLALLRALNWLINAFSFTEWDPSAFPGPVPLWSPQFRTAPARRHRPAGLPGFRDLPLLILAVEHGADAVRVLGAQLHKAANTRSGRGRPGPARPRPSPRSPRCPGRTCCARSWRRSFCRSRISSRRLFMAAPAGPGPAPAAVTSSLPARRHFRAAQFPQGNGAAGLVPVRCGRGSLSACGARAAREVTPGSGRGTAGTT